MEAYQQRVMDEAKELNVKLTKLTAFLDTPVFRSLEVSEQVRLRMQHYFMSGYASVLGERIDAFHLTA
jgi:hypothetical protein